MMTCAAQPTFPYVRFLESTNRFMNCYSGKTLTQSDFLYYNFINCASFEKNAAGSLTFDFDFESTPSKDLILITCSIYERRLFIDNFRNCRIE